MPERDANQLAADVRAAFRDPDPNDHHRLCALRDGQDCDCYALRSADAHLALDALVARITDAEALVRGGNCIRGEDGMSPCEAAEAQVAALTEAAEFAGVPAWTRLFNRAEAAEAALATTRQALTEIAEQQPKTLDWLRSHGIVFDGPLGTDPNNWEHVAFGIYTDLCETDSIARRALAATDTKEPA